MSDCPVLGLQAGVSNWMRVPVLNSGVLQTHLTDEPTPWPHESLHSNKTAKAIYDGHALLPSNLLKRHIFLSLRKLSVIYSQIFVKLLCHGKSRLRHIGLSLTVCISPSLCKSLVFQ